jgi:hypothetical protein
MEVSTTQKELCVLIASTLAVLCRESRTGVTEIGTRGGYTFLLMIVWSNWICFVEEIDRLVVYSS